METMKTEKPVASAESLRHKNHRKGSDEKGL